MSPQSVNKPLEIKEMTDSNNYVILNKGDEVIENQGLFNRLFDLSSGYIYIDNILFLNNKLFIEHFDKNKLGYILNNLEQISEIYRPDARNEVPLDKYYFKSESNSSANSSIINVSYSQHNNGLYGRYYAKNGLSAQGMIREARHTIFKDYYVDIDIDNCHPVITKWICKNLEIECKYLSDYIDNRNEIIQDLIELNPEFNFEYFKKYFLKLSYGCGNDSYNEVKNKNDFLINFRNEIQTIQESISNKLYTFRDIVKKENAKKNKNYNLYGSTLSHICQFVENQLLMIIVEYLKSKDLNIQDSILCFDGIMLNKIKFTNSMLQDIQDLFKSIEGNCKCPIDIKLSIKHMNLDKQILDRCNYINGVDYTYYKKIVKKQLEFNDNYYFRDFITKLIYGVWDFEELREYFIINVNRVLFIVASQKNAFYGRYSKKNISVIEPTPHLVSFYKENKKGEMVIASVQFFKLLGMFYNDIKFYNSLSFVPYSNDCVPSDIDPYDFNLFQGFKASHVNKVDERLIKPILDHWFIVLANSNPDNFHYQLSYFHQILKYPSRKTKVVMIFKSKNQQIGKGALLNDFIGNLIFGNQIYKPYNGLSFINDRFNEDQQGSLLNVVEELSNVDSNSYNATFDRLKSLICDNKAMIEPKYGKKYEINNYTNYICNTNNEFPVKIEMGDARFACFECDERFHKNFDYFNELYKSMNQMVADHFYTYLYNLKDAIDPRNIPNNKFYNSIKFNSCSSSIKFLYAIKDLIELEEEVDFTYDSWEDLFTKHYENDEIQSSILNDCYKKWCNEAGEKHTSMSRFRTFTEKYITFIKGRKYNFYDLKNIDLLPKLY